MIENKIEETRNKIQDLENQQDVLYDNLLNELKVEKGSDLADFIFDYVFNNFWTNQEIQKK